IADAFDDFAPHKAKQPLSTVAKVKLSASERKPVAETAAGGGKQSSQQARNVSPPAEVKQAPEREWNFGVGPRPGEQHGKSLLGKSDPTIWFEAAAALPPLPASDQPISDEDVERLRQQGEQMLANEAASFEREMQKRNAADYKWLQQVKRQGTTADKVAAITLQVQESAVANLAGLDMLLGWVTRRQGGREVVRQALEALQELFLTVLLPDGRRLKHLESQPLASLPSGKEGAKYLLWWFLEDQIKVRYGLFVGALEECSRDNLEFLKDKATKALYTLLVKKPEAEARLLGALVNKLGDPARKLASKAGYLLSQLLLQHPVMKPVVLREVRGQPLAGWCCCLCHYWRWWWLAAEYKTVAAPHSLSAHCTLRWQGFCITKAWEAHMQHNLHAPSLPAAARQGSCTEQQLGGLMSSHPV
ncbi:CBF domain-containing protein, partial [Haematococcus lacustris]